MTSGSVWTHLIVTSRALVDEREERVALAGVAGEAAIPLEDRDGLVHGLADRRDGVGRNDGGVGTPKALAKRDHVVHRDLALAVANRNEIREGRHRVKIAAGDRH